MKPRWITAERFERVGIFTIRSGKKDVFPLLCPVLEYDWIPDWRCTMMYSESGVAEKNALFMTRAKLHRKVMWTTITYEPDRLIEYLLVMGSDAMVRLSISLEDDGGNATRIAWRMLFTAVSPLAKRALRADYSEAKFQAMLGKREGAEPLPGNRRDAVGPMACGVPRRRPLTPVRLPLR
jgi:hypothetical protein